MLYQKSAILRLVLLGIVFFGSQFLAATWFPRSYDWSHDVISSLSSARDNPQAWWVSSIGLAISGLLLASLAPCLAAGSSIDITSSLFLTGSLLLAFCGLWSPGYPGLGRGHDILAKASAYCLLSSLSICSIRDFYTTRSPLTYRTLRLLFVLAPVAGVILSRVLLFTAYRTLETAQYQAVKGQSLLNLAVWEWVGVFVVYNFLILKICFPKL